MEVLVNIPIQTTMPDPSVQIARFGARIEFPVTRAIASYWREGVLDLEGTWTVILDYIRDPGDYLLVWMDDAGENEIFLPITAVTEVAIPSGGGGSVPPPDQWPDVPIEEVLPNVGDVARLERTRTIASGSKEEITFTDDTRPSADDVSLLIIQAAPLVIAEIPARVAVYHYAAIKNLISLYTAILIEGSFYREQEDNATIFWQKLYDAALLQLGKKIEYEYRQWNAAGGRIEIPGPCPPGWVPGQVQVLQPPVPVP